MRSRVFLPLFLLIGSMAAAQTGPIQTRPAQTRAAQISPAQTSPIQTRSAQGSHTLRIGLWTLWHDKEVTIAPVGDATATIQLCPACTLAPLTHALRVQAAGDTLALPASHHAPSVAVTGATLLNAHGESLTLQHPLRIAARNGTLVLAATLPIETYVERVVASESSPADGPESLQALAIVVRTFALHQPHGHTDYDLCDSTHCQLLHWANFHVQQAAAHAATLATAGETLWFHGRRAQAWFHQNCGGRTASPSEAWPAATQSREAHTNAAPWLLSRTDSYCTVNGPRQWSTTLSLADLTAALSAAGLVHPGWTTLTVARRGESGRAVTLQIGDTQVAAEDFRLAVGRAFGWDKALSTWFEVTRLEVSPLKVSRPEVSPQHASPAAEFVFHGRGSGHGVGLCQAGAAAMSALGKSSAEILAQYFPGATAADEAAGQPWQSLPGQGFILQTLMPADAAYLPQLTEALAEAESRAGLQSASPITLRAYASTSAFRDATLAPGWVAAFAEGNLIATQPLRTLASRKLLVSVLRHEFLHALVEALAAANTPLWLREGLVEAWSESPPEPTPSGANDAAPIATPLELEQINNALAHASTQAQSQAAHRAAALYAQRLLARYGRAQVLAWLRSGVPASAFARPR